VGRRGRWLAAAVAVAWMVGCGARGLTADAAGARPRDGIEALRQKVHSGDPLDRLYAAATLLEKGTPEALSVLRDILGGRNDQAARLSVLDAIDRRRDARFVEALVTVLGDADVTVRRRAAEVLGTFQDHGVVDRLARLARDPSASETAQLGAVEALVHTKQTDAVGVLIEMLRSPHKTVRAAALEALRGITPEDFGENYRVWWFWWRRNRHKTQLQWDRDLLPKLQRRVQKLREDLARARRDAIRWARALLETTTDPKKRAALLKEWLRSEYAELRADAARELPRIAGAEGVREALVTVLSDRDARVVAAAAAGLGGLGDAEAVSHLKRLLTREEPEVRAAAAGALGQLRAADAVQDLLDILSDTDESVRAAAVTALGAIQAPQALDGLLERLNDPAPKVREMAVAAVARFKDPRTASALIKVLLEDREAPRARFSAARFLADFPGRAVDEALVKGLADPDPGVRRAAAGSLGTRSGPGLVDPLLARSLADDDRTVREGAWASALAILRREKSLPLIDGVSNRLTAAKAHARAAEVLEIVEALAGEATPAEAALVAALRRRRADAFFLAENWARAAADYRALHAAGDKTVQPRLVESLEKTGAFRSAAQVMLSALPTESAARAAGLAAVIGLAERAAADDEPQEAILILRSLRATVASALETALEDRLTKAAASANGRLDALVTAAAERVKALLGRAAGADETAAKTAAADLVKLGWVAVPALLDGLDGADVKGRTAAVTALRAIAATRHAFDPADDETKRRAAVKRWRAWFQQQRTVPAPSTS